MIERTEIERLDLVARAEATKTLLVRSRIPITVLSAFIVLLAFVSEASFYETLVVRALAILAVATTAMLWMNSRYSPHAVAFLFFMILVGALLVDDPDSRTALSLSAKYAGCAILLSAGYAWATNAIPFGTAQSEEFDAERLQVDEWIALLTAPKDTDPLVEFSKRSFWTGHWTYRLLDAGSCWVTAKFKTRNTTRLLQCRVLERNAVRMTVRPGGELDIQMGRTSVPSVEVSPEMRDCLLKFLRNS
ncbi:MAG: hypothetical protein WBE20_14835 [Candidatus Acidiferrales bacterium]